MSTLQTLSTKTTDRDTWSTLTPEERFEHFQGLRLHEADDFFLDLAAHEQAEIIQALPLGQRRIWLRLLAPDDAADLVQEFDPEDRPAILDDLDDSTRLEVQGLLAYKEDVAGGLM